jgi:merlin
LAREKQLREIAEKEKSIMEQRLMQYQEEIRLANEALVSISKSFT